MAANTGGLVIHQTGAGGDSVIAVARQSSRDAAKSVVLVTAGRVGTDTRQGGARPMPDLH